MLEKYPLFPIGLGAMPLSITGRPSEAIAIDVIQKFIDLGGNFIDTADVYGLDDTDRGHNEKLIRKALGQKLSDNIILATKGGATRPDGGWGMRGGHPKKLRQACEQSLGNLKIDQHQLYYLHGPDPDVPLAESLGELVRMREEGKIKQIGIANIDLDQLKIALETTEIYAVQNRCNPFCKGDLKNGLIEFCKNNSILYVPYCPLGGWADHAKLASSNLFEPLTQKYSVTSYRICLSWLRQLGKHVIAIPGMDNENQVVENLSAVDLTLDSNDMDVIANFPDLYIPKHIEL